MQIRVKIQWTDTAKNMLVPLPAKVRQGLVAKIGELSGSDPRQAGKTLVGPFLGYRRITYSRYRAIFGVREEHVASGDVLIYVTVHVVAVGIRKERDKKDVYKVAQKLIELGLIRTQAIEDEKQGLDKS